MFIIRHVYHNTSKDLPMLIVVIGVNHPNVYPMLVSAIDTNPLVIATNSSMSRLDCSPDSLSLSHWRQFPRSAFPRHHFSWATLRPTCVIYGIIVRPHEAGLTRFRGLASRYEMQQPAPLMSAHHRIYEFPLVSKADTILSCNRCFSIQRKCSTT